MGILSEIFAELTGALMPTQTTATKGGKTPSGKADPFNTSKSAPKNVPISEQRTALEMHAHKHPSKMGSRIEKRPAYAGSLGKLNDEGCGEHGDERYISTSKPMVSANQISIAEMRKAVIMSEILGKPKCKK